MSPKFILFLTLFLAVLAGLYFIPVPSSPKPIKSTIESFITVPSSPKPIKSTIESLIVALDSEQIKESTGFFPPISFIENKGLYKSYVKLNFNGPYTHYLVRKYFSVPDSNMFISNFVSLALIESWELGAIELPQDQLELAINAILGFKDKNNNETDLYNFWLQSMGVKMFTATPLNLVYGIDIFVSGSTFIESVLNSLGLESIYQEYIYPLVRIFTMFRVAFKIPSDADDTSVNLALGAKISAHKAELNDLSKNWTASNSHLNETLNAYLRFAYKPFGNSSDDKMLDPRTYYFLRNYLSDNANRTNLTLINTWITDFSRDNITYPDVAMPVHVNNVDLSVNANSLFGLSHIMVLHPELITPELLNLYSCVSDLLYWAIETGIVLERPDITILYYPSVYDFYWFVARTLSFLEQNQADLKFQEMHETKIKFGRILREIGVYQILDLQRQDQAGRRIYWEDFLGSNDSEPTGEDRLFSTSLAVNMLLDTWTNKSTDYSLYSWRGDTPKEVVETVEKAINFINEEILADNFAKENAFFSASYKGNSSDFVSYPRTDIGNIDGTPFNESSVDFSKFYVGVKGFVNQDVYEQWLNQTWDDNKPVPRTFPGFNDLAFPYWCSPSMTYALAMMGLSKYGRVSGQI